MAQSPVPRGRELAADPPVARSGRDFDDLPSMRAEDRFGDSGVVMGNESASGWHNISRLSSVATLLLLRAVLAFAVVALGLAGCEPFPVHVDPLSVNGRDGGGPPPSYAALMRIGAAARAGGDLTNALGVFRRAAEINPSDPAAFVAIGDTLIAIGSVNEAILAYNSALARDSGDLAAQLGLARAYLQTGRPQLARVPLAKASAQSPNDPKVLLLIGVTEDLAAQHAAAQASYRRGLEYSPADPALTANLALSLALSGDFSAAIDELLPLAMAPAGSTAERQTLALIYGLQGNDVEAARIGRIDLDQGSVESNLAYYRSLRDLPPDALLQAILTVAVKRPPMQSQ
jgi:Flp pilus assembly protein TadD